MGVEEGRGGAGSGLGCIRRSVGLVRDEDRGGEGQGKKRCVMGVGMQVLVAARLLLHFGFILFILII